MNERNWEKVDELLKQLSKKCSGNDGAVVMIQAAMNLDFYLQENTPKQSNSPRSTEALNDIKGKLQEAMTAESKDSSFSVIDESTMLMCKVLYAQKKINDCLNMIKNIDLETISKKKSNPCYKLKLLSEVYALKGLCLEHSSSSHGKPNYDSIVEAYDKSVNMALAYVTDYDKSSVHSSPSSSSSEPLFSYEMELAFQRVHLLHIKNNNLDTAVSRLRLVLKQTKNRIIAGVQLFLTRDLAAILLRGISEVKYASPRFRDSVDSEDVSSAGSPDASVFSDSAQEKPSFSVSSNELNPSQIDVSFKSSSHRSSTFIPLAQPEGLVNKPKFFVGEKECDPTDSTQESILLLLITEAILNTDPILDMSPEHAEARKQIIHDAHILYDLMAVALIKYSLFDMFSTNIEASMRYSYDEFHIWYQYALSLISARRHSRAVTVLEECSRIRPNDPSPYLFAAKICYEQLQKIDKGIELANKALEAASSCEKTDSSNEYDDENEDLLPLAHIAIGVGYCYLCSDGTARDEISEHQNKAISHFTKAHNLDVLDYKPLLFIAIQMAQQRRIREAIQKVKEALELEPHCLNSLHLLALLLSSEKRYKECFSILATACKLYPENINLLITKCKLELCVGCNEEALCTCNTIMDIWQDLYEKCSNSVLTNGSIIERMTSDRISCTNHSTRNELDFDAGSLIANSIAVSRVERALSGIESSVGDTFRRTVEVSASHPMALKAHIWLLITEVYIVLQRYDDAARSLQEASTILPMSHAVLHMQGRLLQAKGELVEAGIAFHSAVTLQPKHHQAMCEWGKNLICRGQNKHAKTILQKSVKLNPMSFDTWESLGDILQLTGDGEGAVKCLATALRMQSTSPVVPFVTIPQGL